MAAKGIRTQVLSIERTAFNRWATTLITHGLVLPISVSSHMYYLEEVHRIYDLLTALKKQETRA